MIKNSIIIVGTFLLISILILGAPSQIKAYPFGDNSKLSMDREDLEFKIITSM